MKKPKKPKLPKLRGVKTTEEKVSDAISNVPRITNETVSEHREEVLAGARKYIYPLEHSKRHIVRNSLGILGLVVVLFFVVCAVNLYKFQGTSSFIYDVTRAVPFPVAKVGDKWVSYESYLFELRRNMHYYQTQQQADFSTKDGQAQLKRLKTQALGEVVQDAYIKQLAEQNHVTVTDQAVTDQVELVKSENRLGSNDRVFREVLNEFWGWNEADFRRELKQQLLAGAVAVKLDASANQRAQATLNKLKHGAKFEDLAKKLSDDQSTRASGGQYHNSMTINSRDVQPSIAAAIFKLKAGQTSGIVKTRYTLEIIKVNESNGRTARASHIQFNLKDLGDYIKPLESKQPPHYYIKP